MASIDRVLILWKTLKISCSKTLMRGARNQLWSLCKEVTYRQMKRTSPIWYKKSAKVVNARDMDITLTMVELEWDKILPLISTLLWANLIATSSLNTLATIAQHKKASHQRRVIQLWLKGPRKNIRLNNIINQRELLLMIDMRTLNCLHM